MNVSPEDGLGDILGAAEAPKPSSVATQEVHTPPGSQAVLGEIVRQALAGTLPIVRPLKGGEVRSFTPQHISMVFDYVTGPMTYAELAEKFQVHPEYPGFIIRHPFAEILIAAMMGQIADNLTDPLARIRAYSHEAIDTKVQIMRDPTTSKAIRAKIAGDFLDRAGYGPRKVDPNDLGEKVPQLPAPVMERFSKSLEGAARVSALDYSRFTKRGGTGEEGQAEKPPVPSDGSAEPQTGRSEVNLPGGPHSVPSLRLEPDEQEKVA